MKTLKTAVRVAGLVLCMTRLQAGQVCEDKPPSAEGVVQAFRAAHRLHTRLEQQSPQVALVARVGQDLSKYGLRYSHIAFVHKDVGSGMWRVKHLLNACGTADSALWQEGLANFFLDEPFAYDALLIVLSPVLQEKLQLALRDTQGLQRLHQARYNMLSHPFSTRYQNSNQWVLEVLAAAVAAPSKLAQAERKTAQDWLQRTQYQPSTVKLGTLTRLGGRMFRANIAFDDHPNERRFAGLIDTVTVESIAQHLQRLEPQTEVAVIAEGPSGLR